MTLNWNTIEKKLDHAHKKPVLFPQTWTDVVQSVVLELLVGNAEMNALVCDVIEGRDVSHYKEEFLRSIRSELPSRIGWEYFLASEEPTEKESALVFIRNMRHPFIIPHLSQLLQDETWSTLAVSTLDQLMFSQQITSEDLEKLIAIACKQPKIYTQARHLRNQQKRKRIRSRCIRILDMLLS